MTWLRIAALGMLAAGCGETAPDPADAPEETARAVPVPKATTPGRAIGTTSTLTAQTSALVGEVSGFQAVQTDFGTRVLLAADTLFDFDRATLTPAAQTNLSRAADLVRAAGDGTVTVTGYTDAKGGPDYNRDLSRRRAESVIAWFKGQPGLSLRAFAAVGRGEADPVAPNEAPGGGDVPAGRAKNRRVVVDIPR